MQLYSRKIFELTRESRIRAFAKKSRLPPSVEKKLYFFVLVINKKSDKLKFAFSFVYDQHSNFDENQLFCFIDPKKVFGHLSFYCFFSLNAEKGVAKIKDFDYALFLDQMINSLCFHFGFNRKSNN